MSPAASPPTRINIANTVAIIFPLAVFFSPGGGVAIPIWGIGGISIGCGGTGSP